MNVRKKTAYVNSLDTDFKASSFVAAMLEEEILEEGMVEIIPSGADRSAYAKDIKSVDHYYSESLSQDRVLIQVNREGLYDMLPEGLFHRTPKYKERLTKEEMIGDVREWRKEEKSARQFFMPFEAELYHLRTLLDCYENRLDKRSSYDDLAQLFAPVWPEFSTLDNEQCIIWMHMIPQIQHKRNDLPFLESIIEVLFDVQATVAQELPYPAQISIPPKQQVSLGKGHLGVDTIIGSHFTDYQDRVIIHIGPLATEKLTCFLPSGAARKLLDMLCHYLLPVQSHVELKLLCLADERIGSLGRESKHAVLGYTAHLSFEQSQQNTAHQI